MPPALLHATTLLVSFVAWQVCRRPLPLPPPALLAIDAASLFFPLLGFSLHVPHAPRALTGQMAYVLALILTNMGILRAVVVPSGAVHTARVTLLAAVPVAVALVALGPTAAFPTWPRSWTSAS